MPNLAWTYTTLKQALQDWPVDDDTRYVSQLDTIIGLGELRVLKDLNIEYFDTIDLTKVTTGSTREAPKLSTMFQIRTVILTDLPDTTARNDRYLERRSYEYCRTYCPGEYVPVAGTEPLYFCELNDTQIYIVPPSTLAYGIEYRGLVRPVGLSGSAATSWLGTNVPDLLFAACLMEAEQFLKADDRYADFKNKYEQELLPTARLELRQSIRSGDYGPMRPAPGPIG
jgi:hypothetical protein